MRKIFYDSLKFISIFFYIRLFSKKTKKQYNCELIVDDISNHTRPDRFEKLNKLMEETMDNNFIKKLENISIKNKWNENYQFQMDFIRKNLLMSIS